MAVFLIADRYRILSEEPKEFFHPIIREIKNYPKNIAEDPILDTEDWENYRSQWYGFELKYPKDWEKPKQKNSTKEDNWEYRYQFRKKEINEDDLFSGLDVIVYDVKKSSRTFEYGRISQN